ncbi:MAG: nuclear transport factor 2 family protein [bacterium]|nr:hypothetical protein [Deltaproteobacteria bacterium]MCP4904164.1 nuclear transport factor 2 family protein [bacterium]
MRDTNSGFDPVIWRQMAAERAIQRVINDYGRGVDERDFERIRGCFHPDATITYGGEPTRTREEGVAWLAQVTPGLFALSHYFGPAIVDLSEDGSTATCQTWCINVLQFHRGDDGEAAQSALGLLYDDVFLLREGCWRIAKRRNRTEWSLAIEGNPRLPLPGLAQPQPEHE